MSYLKQISLVAVIILLASNVSQAGIEIDNFSDPGGASNPLVTRTTSGVSTFTGGTLFLDFSGSLEGTVKYTMVSGNFGSLGDVSGGFNVGIANVLSGANLTVKLNGAALGSASTFSDGTYSVASDLTSISMIEFVFSPLASSPGAYGAILGGGNGAFTAVPEPTSLILVGMAMVGVIVPRRRRS